MEEQMSGAELSEIAVVAFFGGLIVAMVIGAIISKVTTTEDDYGL